MSTDTGEGELHETVSAARGRGRPRRNRGRDLGRDLGPDLSMFTDDGGLEIRALAPPAVAVAPQRWLHGARPGWVRSPGWGRTPLPTGARAGLVIGAGAGR